MEDYYKRCGDFGNPQECADCEACAPDVYQACLQKQKHEWIETVKRKKYLTVGYKVNPFIGRQYHVDTAKTQEEAKTKVLEMMSTGYEDVMLAKLIPIEINIKFEE